jgi:hypothetical protein
VQPGTDRHVIRVISGTGAKEQYNARGITDSDEVSTYVFRRDDAGKPGIQAVIMHGASSDM